MKRLKSRFLALSAAVLMLFSLTGCEDYTSWEENRTQGDQSVTYIDTSGWERQEGSSLADYVNQGLKEADENGFYHETDYSSIRTDNFGQSEQNNNHEQATGQEQQTLTRLAMIDKLAEKEYDGKPYIEVNNNVPYFAEEDFNYTDAFEYYSDLDSLGRTQYAFALLDETLMPPDGEERGDISSVKPTGWVQAKYDSIGNGGWIYNRCHLIAWALAGENDNKKNLMTGTRYFNVEGMLSFEIRALDYLDDNPGNHLLYRATPVYEEDGLLAKGLLLEAYSIEDDGELSFCVFIFNVQPGIIIDYQTGESRKGN